MHYNDVMESCHSLDKLNHPLVLAVDDDEDNLVLLTQLLELSGCSFISAKDGKTAVGMALQQHPDLILLDMMLPDISGLDVVQSLQQDRNTKDIPIIAVTAVVDFVSQQQFLIGGCLECITKPYDIDKLEAIIYHHLSQSPQGRE